MAKRRAVIYARFSSELQNERSIEDQIELCTQYANREGYEVVHAFHDRARSGASVFGRDGLQSMMDHARDKHFDVLIVEALDRLSRDMEDLAGIHKRLTFFGVEIRAVHEGKADAMQVGLRGLLGSLFLSDLAHKVRRGLQGVVRDGRSAGGRAYGYRPVPGQPGQLVIHEDEAAVVRRIFEAYVSGTSPRDIAAALNADRIPPPRGALWSANTINGNATRMNGMLLNDAYRGVLIWNRLRFIKDPATGKRVPRANPESEWQRADAPHLRIVSDELWQAAHDRKLGRKKVRALASPKKRHLLSGLLRCSVCGGGMSVWGIKNGKRRIVCTASRESGSCPNKSKIDLGRVEAAFLDNMTAIMSAPDALQAMVDEYLAEWERLAKANRKGREELERKEANLSAAMKRYVRWIGEGIEPPNLREMVIDTDKQLTEVRAQLAATDEVLPPPKVHPAVARQYAADLSSAARSITESGSIDPDLRAAIHKLIDRVVVQPGQPPQVEVIARIATLVTAPLRLKAGRGGKGGEKMVAGERYNFLPPLDFMPPPGLPGLPETMAFRFAA